MIEIASICPDCGNYDSSYLQLKIALITKIGNIMYNFSLGLFFKMYRLGNSISPL